MLTVRDIYGNVAKVEEFDRVYIVGAGKATLGMAYGVCSILGNKVAAGAITVPYGTKAKEIKRVLVTEASHPIDRKSTRLNSSHANISYAVFCLKKKKHSLHINLDPH